MRATVLKSPPKTRASTGNAHVRSTTMESFATSNDTVEDPIPEEEEELAESAGSKAIRNLPATVRPVFLLPLSPGSLSTLTI